MRLEEKLQLLRKERGLSQEALAEQLDVSRQAVSKWESGQSYPETEKLIALGRLYGVTLDSLLNDGPIQYLGASHKDNTNTQTGREDRYPRGHRPWILDYEYKSEKTLFGLPLVHINIGWGLRRAKGVLAIGNISTGFLSIGLLSVGLLSMGLLGLGLISVSAVAFGLLAAIGSVAIGGFALGAVAIGFVTLGAVSIGMVSVGAVSVASHIAIGDHAYGTIAIGRTLAEGTRVFLCANPSSSGWFQVDTNAVRAAIAEEHPNLWSPLVRWAMGFVR